MADDSDKPSTSSPDFLKPLLSAAGGIKLQKGLVTKLITMAIAGVLGLAAIGWQTGSEKVRAGIVVCIVIVIFYVIHRILAFAEKNPGIALLEGAEFINFHREFSGVRAKGLAQEIPIDAFPLVDIPAEDVVDLSTKQSHARTRGGDL